MTDTTTANTNGNTASSAVGSDYVLSHLSLLVGDQEEALKFYRDVVGLEVRLDVPLGPVRWLTVGPAAQPQIEIILETPEMVPDPEWADAARARLGKKAQSTIIFLTADVDATFARLVDAGVPVAQEVVDQPYGFRDCGFTDPWGNQVRFSKPIAG